MTRIEHTVRIEAPVEEVFKYAADYQSWAQWFEGVSDFQPTSEITRGNGARYAYKVRLLGFTAAVETEIHDLVINRGWTGIATRGMAHRTYWNFQQIENKTRFTYALEYRLPIPLLGPLLDSLLMKPQWNRIIVNSLNNLRQRFSGPAPGAPH